MVKNNVLKGVISQYLEEVYDFRNTENSRSIRGGFGEGFATN